jgi:hypothetical protein
MTMHRERPLTDLWNAFPPMPLHEIDQQPRSVWREVEVTIWRHRHSTVRYVTGTQAGSSVPVDWLCNENFETLQALDVPVRQLFALCALRQRQERA